MTDVPQSFKLNTYQWLITARWDIIFCEAVYFCYFNWKIYCRPAGNLLFNSKYLILIFLAASHGPVIYFGAFFLQLKIKFYITELIVKLCPNNDGCIDFVHAPRHPFPFAALSVKWALMKSTFLSFCTFFAVHYLRLHITFYLNPSEFKYVLYLNETSATINSHLFRKISVIKLNR